MPAPWLNPLAVAASNGKFYVVGSGFVVNGFNGTNSQGGFVDEYDPVADNWTSRASMPDPSGSAAVFTSLVGRH